MKLRLSSRCLRDLDEIFDYISQDNVDAAAHTIDIILGAAEQLLQHPRLGRPGRREGTRELVHSPYIIVYTIGENVINIEAVLHGSRKFQ